MPLPCTICFIPVFAGRPEWIVTVGACPHVCIAIVQKRKQASSRTALKRVDKILFIERFFEALKNGSF
jgi:hypothetical protein